MNAPHELGPWLSRLVSPPAPVSPGEVLLSGLRLRLLTRLFERQEWGAAWHEAVLEAGKLVAAEVEMRLRRAAMASRYPKSRLNRALPDREARGMLAAKLSASGIGLEESLAGTVEPSEAEIRMLCGKLEVAWNRLVATADQELAAADRTAATIQAWKRPLAPLLIGSGALLAVLAWAGLVLGGYLESPSWFRPIAALVWNR